MIKGMIVVSILLISQLAYAEPNSLNCVLKGAETGAEYVVDIEKRIVVFGMFRFEIVHVDKDYITAVHLPYKKSSFNQAGFQAFPSGGRIWTMNRNTGDFVHAWIGLGIYPGESTDKMRLVGDSDHGVCTKKVL